MTGKVAALQSFLLGVVVSVIGVGVAILGPDGFGRMLAEHWGVLVHTGHYGEGHRGVVDPSVAWGNVQTILGRDPAFTAWLGALVLLLAWIAFRRWRRGELPVEAQSMLLFLSVSFGLGILAAVKHFNPHYLIPPLVVLPFVVLSLRPSMHPLLLLAVVAGSAALDVRVALAEHTLAAADRAQRQAYRAEVARVRALPLHGGIRAWTYKALAPEYGISFVTDIANHRGLDALVYPATFPQDRGYFRDIPPGIPWEYVVYTRRYAPRTEDIPRGIREATLPAFVGEYLLVLRRKDFPQSSR